MPGLKLVVGIVLVQAGGIRSAYYCDRSLAMPRDIFTPWVVSLLACNVEMH